MWWRNSKSSLESASRQVNAVSALSKFLQVSEEEVGPRKGCTFKAHNPMLKNQSESMINEAISTVDSSIKLARVGEPNNPYLHFAVDRHRQIKWIIVSSSSADPASTAEVIKW